MSKVVKKEKKEKEDKDYYTEVEWRDLTPIGFEYNTWEEMLDDDWEFPLLKEQFKEGGVLSNASPTHQVYMFLGAQPIVSSDGASGNMPYIVVIDCDSKLPEKVAKVSIQNGEADILSFKDASLKWQPYIPSKYQNNNAVKVNQSKILALMLNERPGKSLSEDKMQLIQYILPYCLIPKRNVGNKPKDVNFVSFDMELEITEKGKQICDDQRKEKEDAWNKWSAEQKALKPKDRSKDNQPEKPSKKKDYKETTKEDGTKVYTKVFNIYFDKLNERLAEFIPDFIEDNGINEDKHDDIEQAIRNEFKKQREINQKKFEEQENVLKSYTDEEKKNYDNMKIYKFYPTHEEVDTEKFASKNINRYFGDATKTFPEESKHDLSKIKQADITAIKKLGEKEIKSNQEKYEQGKKQYEEEKAKEAGATNSKKRKEPETSSTDDAEEEKEENVEKEKEETKPAKPTKSTTKKPAKAAAKNTTSTTTTSTSTSTSTSTTENKESKEDEKPTEKSNEKVTEKPTEKPAKAAVAKSNKKQKK